MTKAKPVALAYRFEPDLPWHAIEHARQAPKKSDWPDMEIVNLYSEADYLSALSEAAALREEIERMRMIIAGCQWHWPVDDTSSDACADGPWEIAENCDLPRGEIMEYARGGVVETRFYAFLDPAEDADSDDNFEVDEATEEAAAGKIAAELERRKSLRSTS